MLSAQERYQRAREAQRVGRYREARRLLLAALRQTTDPELLSSVETTLGWVENELGDPHAGLELLDSAYHRRRFLPSLLTGQILAQRALLRVRMGDLDQALRDFSQAIPLLSDDPAELGKALLNRGNLALERGQPAKAREDFERAVEQYGAALSPIGIAKSQHNLGYAAMLQGEVALALRLMDQAFQALAEDQSPALIAMCQQDRAEALLAAGLLDEGATALQAAADGFGSQRLRRHQAEAEFVLARTLSASDPARAAKVARRAERLFEGAGAPTQALRARAVRVTCQLRLDKRVAGAGELAAELTRAKLTRDALGVRIQLGEFARGPRRRRLPSDTPLPLRLAAAEVEAAELLADGRADQALAAVTSGLREVQRWQARFASLDLQTSLGGHGQRLAGIGLDAALSLGRPDLVYRWVERTGAMAGRVAPVRPPSDPAVAADLTELRVLAARPPKPGSPEAQHQTELLQRVRERAWQDPGSARLNVLRPLAQVRRELRESGATLVSLMSGLDQAWAFVASPRRSSLVALGAVQPIRAALKGLPADLDLAASDLPEPIAGSVRASLADRIASLDALILAPVASMLIGTRVVINPTGIFSGLPWTLMPSLAGCAVTIPRSASAWVSARERPHEYALAGFAAGPRLERSEGEVVQAAGHWGRAEVLRGAAANAGSVTELAGRVDVLHLAAHGHHVVDNPLFSNLELADGPWFGYDLDQLADIPEVVILSACELGATTIRRGDELLGLTTAWLHAGARCVIASPASVSDEVAAAILPEVHAELAQGTMPADALVVATRRHPELVSTFQCYGAGW